MFRVTVDFSVIVSRKSRRSRCCFNSVRAQVFEGSSVMRSLVNFALLTCLVTTSLGKDKAYNLMVGQLLRFHRNQSHTYDSETLPYCTGNSVRVNVKKYNMSSHWVISNTLRRTGSPCILLFQDHSSHQVSARYNHTLCTCQGVDQHVIDSNLLYTTGERKKEQFSLNT